MARSVTPKTLGCKALPSPQTTMKSWIRHSVYHQVWTECIVESHHTTVQSLICYVEMHVTATFLDSSSSAIPSSSHKWSVTVVQRNSRGLRMLKTRLDSNLTLLWSDQKHVKSETTHKTLNRCDLNSNASAHLLHRTSLKFDIQSKFRCIQVIHTYKLHISFSFTFPF